MKSLEHIIRQIAEASAMRNSELRKKVVNVARPDDAKPTDGSSKLAKQGEIKTKVIGEETYKSLDSAVSSAEKMAKTGAVEVWSHGGKFYLNSVDYKKEHDDLKSFGAKLVKVVKEEIVVEAAAAGNGDEEMKTDATKKEKTKDKDKVDAKKINGGKTEVDLEPSTDDRNDDGKKEDDKGKRATKEANKTSGIKEQKMTNTPYGLPQSLIDAVNEALKSGQKNLDKAPPFGKLTGDDFKKLRGEGSKPDFLNLDKGGNKKEPVKGAAKQAESTDEATKYFSPKDRESAARSARTSRAAAANPAQPKDKAAQHSKEAEWLEKLSKKRTISTNNEEVECLDELGNATLQSYRNKTFINPKRSDDYSPEAKAKRERTRMNRYKGQETSYNKMIGKAKSGINSTELNKKANEEVENVDEVTSALLYRAKTAAQKKASWLMPGDKGKGDKAWNRVKKFRDAGVAKEKQEKQQKVAEDLDEALVKSSNGYYEVIHKGEKVGKYRQSNDARNHAAKLNEASTNNTNEVEELDELSKAAVGSYLKKSPQDLKNLEAGREKGESLPDHIRRNRMQNNRTVGIIRGVNKLTGNAKVPANKEVEELDEVGYTPQVRNKLRDYLVKAKNSGADAHMMYHTGRALGNEPDEDNVRELKNRSKGIRRAKERINRDMYREEVGFSEAEIARLEEIAKKFD